MVKLQKNKSILPLKDKNLMKDKSVTDLWWLIHLFAQRFATSLIDPLMQRLSVWNAVYRPNQREEISTIRWRVENNKLKNSVMFFCQVYSIDWKWKMFCERVKVLH